MRDGKRCETKNDFAPACRDSTAGGIAQNLYFDRTFRFDKELENRVRSVTLEEVNQAICDRLDISRLTIVKAGDFANNRATIG